MDQIAPLVLGGTGSHSEQEIQPRYLPDKFESGTQNIVGIAGLNAGIKWILAQGIEAIRTWEMELTKLLVSGLLEIQRIRLYGAQDPDHATAIISATVAEKEVSEIGLELDAEYGILSRVGLHCAPAAHRTIGSFPTGTVRFGLSHLSTAAEVQTALEAVADLAGRG